MCGVFAKKNRKDLKIKVLDPPGARLKGEFKSCLVHREVSRPWSIVDLWNDYEPRKKKPLPKTILLALQGIKIVVVARCKCEDEGAP